MNKFMFILVLSCSVLFGLSACSNSNISKRDVGTVAGGVAGGAIGYGLGGGPIGAIGGTLGGAYIGNQLTK